MNNPTDTKQAILEYVNMARKRPQLASDPAELDRLEQAALTSFMGAFGALHAPIAPMTWEARTLFLGSTVGGPFVSERIQLDVPFPCMIVGALPSLSQLGSGAGALVSTLNDIDVSIDLNNHEYMTQAQGTTTPVVGAALTRDNTFVTLASLGAGIAQGARLLGWTIPYRTAQIGVTYRWAQGGGVFKDAHVKIAFFARALQEQ